MKDTDELAQFYSRQNESLGTKLLEKTRDRLNQTIDLLSRTQLDTTANNNADISRSSMHPTSEELLSRTHNFRFSQQRFEKEKELNGGRVGVYSLVWG